MVIDKVSSWPFLDVDLLVSIKSVYFLEYPGPIQCGNTATVKSVFNEASTRAGRKFPIQLTGFPKEYEK